MRIHLWKNVSLVSFVLLLIGSITVFAGQTQKGSDIQFYGFLRMDMAYNYFTDERYADSGFRTF